jgi:hypothetical protein
MKYIINQEHGLQTVTVEASGMINTKVAVEMAIAIGVELDNTDFQKCLINLTSTELDPKQTMTEMFMFVEVFKKAGIKKSVKMAALILIEDDHLSHLEKAANLEGYKLKHFTTRNKALNWLCV